jgi:hypothetical protein
MRVCTAGEGSGSDSGAGGSGNQSSSMGRRAPVKREVDYGGRVAGIDASAGEVGDMGRSGQIGSGGKRGVLM